MSRSNKRKRVQEELTFEPDSKKRKLDAKFKPLETYDIEAIKEICQKTNKKDSVDIDLGFTLIPPNCLLIKLNSKRQFHKISNKVNDLWIELDAAKRPEKLTEGATLKLEVFVTGNDVEIDVDDPNGESHYLHLGPFAVSTSDAQNLVLRSAKPLTSKAISKLGNHVVEPSEKKTDPDSAKEEESVSEINKEDRAGSSSISTRAQKIIEGLPNLHTLPKLAAPDPFTGKFNELNYPELKGMANPMLFGSAQAWDLTVLGRGLMHEDCPFTIINLMSFQGVTVGVETLIAGVAHSHVTELLLTNDGVAGVADPLPHAALFGSLLATSTRLNKLSLRNLGPTAFDSLCAGLNESASLETLVLCNSDLNDDRLRTLVAVLCNPKSKLKLKQLNLNGNTFTSASAEWLQYLLENNQTLEGISLSDNENLKEEFGIHLGKGLAKNKTVKRIHFHKTKLGAKGAANMLKEMTGHNNTIELLNLETVKLGKLGGDALTDFIQQNDSLLHLNIGSTGIAEKTWPALLKVLEAKDTLLKLDINQSDARVGDLEVGKLIAASLRLNEMRHSHYNLLYDAEVVSY